MSLMPEGFGIQSKCLVYTVVHFFVEHESASVMYASHDYTCSICVLFSCCNKHIFNLGGRVLNKVTQSVKSD